MNKLEQIMDEVDNGIRKLDKGDIWTANSHSVSILIVSLFLLLLAIGGLFIGVYITIKWKVVKRLR